MSLTSRVNMPLTAASYTDVLALDATMANTPGVSYQNRGSDAVEFIAGGASQPAASVPGMLLNPGATWTDTNGSANFWWKGAGRLVVTKE